jgi:hypothetical protein
MLKDISVSIKQYQAAYDIFESTVIYNNHLTLITVRKLAVPRHMTWPVLQTYSAHILLILYLPELVKLLICSFINFSPALIKIALNTIMNWEEHGVVYFTAIPQYAPGGIEEDNEKI